MMSIRHLSYSIVALLALSVTAAMPASATPSIPLPIAVVRHAPIGSTVTVIGSVTVPTNAFDAGFAIQDLVDGIYVLDSGAANRHIGDRVAVTGTLVDNFGLLSIQPTSVTGLGRGRVVAPRHRSTGSVGEATEGRLLELDGDMVGDLIDDGPFGFKLNIDDGSGPIQIFLFPGSGISVTGLHDGVSIHVVCFSNQFDTTFECDPRQVSDFEVE
jgi:hypothetical protein